MPTPDLKNFLSICSTFKQAMLVTQKSNGQLVARPMYVAELEEDGDLWFATDSSSGKVDEILENKRVCVTMSGGGKHISISGQATLVIDRYQIDRLWSEPWRVWFPGGPDDATLVLIKVDATEGEYWSNAGANRVKYLFEATKAYLQGKRLVVDETQHAKVDL